MKPRSLRVRLALWALLLLCLAQLIVSTVFFMLASQWLENQVDHTLFATSTQIATVISEQDNLLNAGNVNFQFDEGSPASQAFLRGQHFFVRLVDLSTGAIIDTSAASDAPVSPASQSGQASYETLPLSSGTQIRLYTQPLPQNPRLAIQVGISLDQMHSTQVQVLRLLVVSFGMTALFATLSGWFIGIRALVPIYGITHTAAEINATDLSLRLDVKSSDTELQQLGQTFNAMLDRIDRAFRQQRQFIADAAHELRTPLSVMQAGVDVVLSQERNADQYRAALETVREEVDRLTQLTQSLLMLARSDAQELVLNRQFMDLSTMLDTVLDQFAPIAEERQIVIERDIPPHILLYGDDDRLIQVALNLIENAVKYTPKGETVRVAAQPGEDMLEFTVANSGTIIPATALEHIFDRFYRADRSRSRDQGGIGLGLAIARQIVELHGGRIEASSNAEQGTCFSVTLPRNAA